MYQVLVRHVPSSGKGCTKFWYAMYQVLVMNFTVYCYTIDMY